MTPSVSTPIRHDPDQRRFATRVDGFEAVLDYRRDGDAMVIEHTGVPSPIGGRGIASQLVRAAFEHARSEGWSVRTPCSYAAAWARRHPEYNPLLA